MKLPPALLADWARWNAQNTRTRREYATHPHAGTFTDNRQQPCTRCGEPTYSLRGLCAAHRKGES